MLDSVKWKEPVMIPKAFRALHRLPQAIQAPPGNLPSPARCAVMAERRRFVRQNS